MMNDLLVVKLGGGAGLDIDAACDDLAAIAAQRPLVIVHGVSAMANALTEQYGFPVRMLTSPSGHTSRYTDPHTRDIFVEAAEGVSAQIVSGLRMRGINALGLTGDDTVILGARKSAIRAVIDGRVRVVHDDYSGAITGVRAERLRALLGEGIVPVLPPMALSETDGLLNIDGDRASASVAAALGADDLIILSNVRGLYRHFPDENSFAAQVSFSQFETALGWAQGRMKRKVIGAQEALQGGARRVTLADGRINHPVQRALAGEGTVFTR